MSPAAVISFAIIALVLHLTSVSGLKCHCDFCSRKNNTCETDGFCLSLTWLQRETGIVHHAYRCLDRKMFFPRPYPTHCTLSSDSNITVRSACCSRDMCNLQLKPALEVPTTEAPASAGEPEAEEWFHQPRARTHLAKLNATRHQTLANGPALNFINSTEQQH